jgi:hypothetical protein
VLGHGPLADPNIGIDATKHLATFGRTDSNLLKPSPVGHDRVFAETGLDRGPQLSPSPSEFRRGLSYRTSFVGGTSPCYGVGRGTDRLAALGPARRAGPRVDDVDTIAGDAGYRVQVVGAWLDCVVRQQCLNTVARI